MVQCPNCGEQVGAGVEYCSHCGKAIPNQGGDHAGERGGGDSGSPGRPEQSPHQGPETRGSTGPAQESHYGGPGGTPQRPPRPQEQPGSGSGGGLTRRRLLGAGAGIAVLGGGGWYFFLREEYPETPTGVVERSWKYWENGNPEKFRELYHVQSPQRESWGSDFFVNFGPRPGVEWELVSTELRDQSRTEAVVRERHLWKDPANGVDEMMLYTRYIELRKSGSEWKIWSIEVAESEPVE